MSKTKWFSILVALALMAILWACNPNPQPVGLTPIPSLAPPSTQALAPALQNTLPPGAAQPSSGGGPAQGDSALGAHLYLLNCSPCHGTDSQGEYGPPLRNSQFIQTGGQDVYNTIAMGRLSNGMPAWLQANGGPFTANDINNIITYLQHLQNLPAEPRAPTPTPEPTETPQPGGAPPAEPARPSNPGGPGQAVKLQGDPKRGIGLFGTYCSACHGPEGLLGVPNPDSDDGAVPVLNPIDPTIANKDPKVFAQNIDLFIEHGSIPSGPSPVVKMPAFGDYKLLDPQQIADIIAYILQLNPVK